MPMETSILAFAMALNVLSGTPVSGTVLNSILISDSSNPNIILSTHEMSLANRQRDNFVNGVFRDNILLNIAYMAGKINNPGYINWDEIRKPFSYKITLDPGEVFAFHDDVLSKYKGKISKTTNAHFSSREGFKTDGYLYGDGVCHLATLINWAAKDAGLDVQAPTKHDFAPVPGVPAEYGVSIYYYPGVSGSNSLQNLYIRNNFNLPVIIAFDYFNDSLKVSVFKNFYPQFLSFNTLP